MKPGIRYVYVVVAVDRATPAEHQPAIASRGSCEEHGRTMHDRSVLYTNAITDEHSGSYVVIEEGRVSGGCSRGTSSATARPGTSDRRRPGISCSRRCCRRRSCASASTTRTTRRRQNKPLPPEPLLFIKPSTSVIGPGEAIVLPEGVGRVDHEAECARRHRPARDPRAREARRTTTCSAIICVNDVTARELQNKGAATRAPRGSTPSRRSARASRSGLDYTAAERARGRRAGSTATSGRRRRPAS